MEFDNDVFDFFNNDIKFHNEHDKENFDFPIAHSTPSVNRLKQQIRSIDFPSIKKHYGIVTFFDYQLPIIYRLINDAYYIPYIRFSYVLHIFEHSSCKNFLVNIRNLPVIEMTPIEQNFYNQLSSLDNNTDWSMNQLLSVSLLDGTLAIMNFIQNYKLKENSLSNEWQEGLDKIRRETRDRWILDEKIVLNRLKQMKEIESTCISSTTMAKRRSFFEERLEISIVDDAGGFVQIDSYIYPFIKNQLDNQIYINLNDIRQKYISPDTHTICYTDQSSPMYRAYSLVMQQAQSNYEWNRIRHSRNNDLSKLLPCSKTNEGNTSEIIPFLPLQILLYLFRNKDSNINIQFVQLFETSSLDEIELNYKNNVARQFIMNTKRQGGLINNHIPCLINSQMDHYTIWIPNEIKTRRIMTNDERLYLNLILIYNGLWKNVLIRKRQWYLKEIDANDKENMNMEFLSDIARLPGNN